MNSSASIRLQPAETGQLLETVHMQVTQAFAALLRRMDRNAKSEPQRR